MDVAGDEGVGAPGGGLDFPPVEEDPGPAGETRGGFLGDGPVVVPAGAVPAHHLGDEILNGRRVPGLPGPVPERAQPGGQEAVTGIVAQAVAVDDAQAAAPQAQVQAADQADPGGAFQASAGDDLAITPDHIHPPASFAQSLEPVQHRGVAGHRTVGIQPIFEEIPQQHQVGRMALRQLVQPGSEGARAILQVDIAGNEQDGVGHGAHGCAAICRGKPGCDRGNPSTMPPVQLLRLAPAWDTATARTWCQGIAGHVAAATEKLHEARNALVRLDGPGGAVVVKAFGRGHAWRSSPVAKAIASYDNAQRLLDLGVPSPLPLAVVADGRCAWYVCVWADGFTTAWAIHDGEADAADALGTFVGDMHEAGALHRDNTPGNTLVRQAEDGTWEFTVVDVNRVSFGPVGMLAGLGSLVQLECSERLLPAYLLARRWPRGGLPVQLFALLKGWHRFRWWLKDGTRPWRRRLGL